jgi:hypothetical protein
MHTITLVCSIHNANGKCNVEQMAIILRALGPDIIFQEVRPSDEWSLEAQAVTEYRKFKLCQPVHVDGFKAPADAAEIKKLIDSGFEYVAEMSEEYRRLENENHGRTCQDGFSYLNSVDFEKSRARMSEIEDEIIEGKAGDALRWWRQVMHSREVEMMRNIYAYCRENAFDTGVFLVGAGHKTGIAKQIENFNRREPNLIVWHLHDGHSPMSNLEIRK